MPAKWAANDLVNHKFITEQNQDDLTKPRNCQRKVLDINWNIEIDIFIYDFGNIIELYQNLQSTKRTIFVNSRNVLRPTWFNFTNYVVD